MSVQNPTSFVFGWSAGNEDEEVVIDDEGDAIGDIEADDDPLAAPVPLALCLPQESPSCSAAPAAEEEIPRITSIKPLDARRYRKAFAARPPEAKPGSGKGKEPAVAEEEKTGKRKLALSSSSSESEMENSAGPSSGSGVEICNTGGWTHQWVSCSLCKKWRRIPFELEVEKCWECRDNVWDPDLASCNTPQEPASAVIPDVDQTGLELEKPPTDDKPQQCMENGEASLPMSQSTSQPHSNDESVPMDLDDGSPAAAEPSTREACHACGSNAGEMMLCSGESCSNRYHFSCLDPPLASSSPEPGRCNACLKASLPKIEALFKWSAPGDEELYYVKWKGRSHIHNTVMSEAELLKVAPKKLSSFKKSLSKALNWDSLWTEPQRIVSRREAEGGQIQYLIKWNGLGYDQCTWEAGSAKVFEAELFEQLQVRFTKWCRFAARDEKFPRLTPQRFEKLAAQPLSLRGGELNQHQLETLNSLRECWFNKKLGIALCELNKEDIVSVISFIISLFREFDARHPVLVVTSAEMLQFWEQSVTEWDPDLNTVIYHGSGEIREFIQQHEFGVTEGRVKVNVVVSTYDIVASDMDFLKTFSWEAVLVDEARFTKVGKDMFLSFGQLKSNYRLVFSDFSEPCKNNSQDLLQMLSFIDGAEHQDEFDAAGVVEKLRQLVVCNCKTNPSSNFTEFWIPVHMSPVQIHEYCAGLIRRYELLRSSSSPSLADAMQTLRSCCCHPYLVADALQKTIEELVPPAEYLQIGIRVSGKLELLQKLLQEFRSRKKTVLILVQSRSRRLGDILDDFLRQQFGQDSFQRIDKRMDNASRQASVQRFNARGSGCFALLLERGAAVASAQLKSLDAVVIYESDWDPSRDTSFLQKLGITSKFNLYRLYTCLTLEEKILVDARRGILIDRKLPQVNSRVLQELLRWDARTLLQIDDWLVERGAAADPRMGWEELKPDLEKLKLKRDEVEWPGRLFFLEFMEVRLLAEGLFGYSERLQRILTPRLAGEEGSPLYKVPALDSERGFVSSESFWLPLIRDKHAQSQEPQQRQRTRSQAENAEIPEPPELPPQRKRRKEPCEAAGERETLPDKGGTPAENNAAEKKLDAVGSGDEQALEKKLEAVQDDGPATSAPRSVSEGTKNQREEQEELLRNMLPELKSMCDVLHLPNEAFERAKTMLDFVMKKLRVTDKFAHELELSLCWIAAEQLNISFNTSEALSISSSSLSFDMEENAVQVVRERLKNQLLVSLPHLFISQNNSSSSSSSNKTSDSPAPKQPEPEPETPTANPAEAPPAEPEPDPVFQRLRGEVSKLKSERNNRILAHLKEQWGRVLNRKERRKSELARMHATECRVVETLQPNGVHRQVQLLELKKRYEAQLTAVEEQHKQNMDSLRSMERAWRSDEARVINSYVEQIDAGINPGPLPELVFPEVTGLPLEEQRAAELVSQEPDEQLQVQGPGEVVQSERSEPEAEPVEQQQRNASRQAVAQATEERPRAGERQVINRGLNTQQRGCQVNHQLPIPTQNQPSPQLPSPTQNQASIQLPSPTQNQVSSQLPSPTQNQVNLQLPVQNQVIPAQNQANLQLQQVNLQLPAQNQVNLQLPAQSSLVPVDHLNQTSSRVQVVGDCQQQMVVPPHVELQACQAQRTVVQAEQPIRIQERHPATTTQNVEFRSPGPVRQAAAQCPLVTEEMKLGKEIEKSKKIHDDEMVRLSREMEAVKRKFEQLMDTERMQYLHRNELLQNNLQKVKYHRRLADALRHKDKLVPVPRSATPGRHASRYHYDSELDIASWSLPPRQSRRGPSSAPAAAPQLQPQQQQQQLTAQNPPPPPPPPTSRSATVLARVSHPRSDHAPMQFSAAPEAAAGEQNSIQNTPYPSSIPPFPGVPGPRENQNQREAQAAQGFGVSPPQGRPRNDGGRVQAQLRVDHQLRPEQQQHFRTPPVVDHLQQQVAFSTPPDYLVMTQAHPILLAQQLAVPQTRSPVALPQQMPHQRAVSANNNNNNNTTTTAGIYSGSSPVVTREIINNMRTSSQAMYSSIGENLRQQAMAGPQFQQQQQQGIGVAGIAFQQQQQQQAQVIAAGIVGVYPPPQHHQGGLQQAQNHHHHHLVQQQGEAGIGAVVQNAVFVHQMQQHQQPGQRAHHPLDRPPVYTQSDYICLSD